jgi:nicotinate-nucleotide adenylyltransferase
MRIGVLGGTFDPPHLGHLVLAASARHSLALDRVLFVPAGIPWRKADRTVTPAPLRMRMVEAAIAGLEWAAVSTIEVDREGPSYASETMRALVNSQNGQSEWWFVLGADALADLPNWHAPEGLLAVARLALAQRDEEGLSAEIRTRFPGIEKHVDPVGMPALAVSSSDMRERVRDGRPTDLLLPGTVRTVIDDLGLYLT